MKRNYAVALLISISLIVTVGQGQSPSNKPAAPTKAEQEIINMEQGWLEATKQRDEATLNRIMAPEFHKSSIDNNSLEWVSAEKAWWMKNAMEYVRHESYTIEKISVRIYDNTAIVEIRLVEKLITDDLKEGEYRYNTSATIDTWVRRADRWQVVAQFVAAAKEQILK